MYKSEEYAEHVKSQFELDIDLKKTTNKCVPLQWGLEFDRYEEPSEIAKFLVRAVRNIVANEGTGYYGEFTDKQKGMFNKGGYTTYLGEGYVLGVKFGKKKVTAHLLVKMENKKVSA